MPAYLSHCGGVASPLDLFTTIIKDTHSLISMHLNSQRATAPLSYALIFSTFLKIIWAH